MITRILILFCVVFVFSVEGENYMFSERDVPVLATIAPKKDAKNKVNQKPPENFPYENATVITDNSTLLNHNNSLLLQTNKSVNQTDEKTNNKTVNSQSIENPTNITNHSQPTNNTQQENSIAKNAEVKENSTSNNLNISVNSLTTIPPPKPTDTEVSDLLKGSVVVYNKTDVVKPAEETEDFRIEHPVSEENTGLIQGQLAAVLAGVFVVIAIIGYIGLISWRKYLENRYRDRQMLVDDMEFNEREDTQYFTI